jgi:non-structural maintenance of chromosomes element 4
LTNFQIYAERGNTPISYYELIIDPEDFMNTVDNAFQISFLVRDGNIGLGQDDKKNPTIRPVNKTEQSQKSADSTTVQCIVGLNPKMWREMINKYQIEEPLLVLNREEFLTQQTKGERNRDENDN